MHVKTDPDVFADSRAAFEVAALLRLFISGRHRWRATSDAVEALEARADELLASSIRATAVSFARQSFQQSAAYATESVNTVTVSSSNCAAAVGDLTRSAILVLEDVVSDRAFIAALGSVFRRQRLVEALAKNWLQIHHGGGSRAADVAREAQSGFETLFRVVVMLDSDCLFPGARSKYHDVRDALQAVGVAVHVLERREAENYVPNRAIWEGGHSLANSGSRRLLSSKLDALKKLDNDQRGHYDMKIGFKTEGGQPVVPPEQAVLYMNVDSATLSALQGGFGNDLLSCLVRSAHRLTTRDFADLGNEAEIERLLATIEGVI